MNTLKLFSKSYEEFLLIFEVEEIVISSELVSYPNSNLLSFISSLIF